MQLNSNRPGFSGEVLNCCDVHWLDSSSVRQDFVPSHLSCRPRTMDPRWTIDHRPETPGTRDRRLHLRSLRNLQLRWTVFTMFLPFTGFQTQRGGPMLHSSLGISLRLT